MQSQAATVDQYLAELPPDRRAAVEAVRKVLLDNLDPTFEEGMQYGMIGYYVPHRVYPAGYHCDPKQPLCFAGLASQKNHMALYMMCVYDDGENADRFKRAWAKTGKKLDMGKSCIRFKKHDDLALDVIAETLRRTPAIKFIARYEAQLAAAATRKAKGADKPGQAKRPAAKRAEVKKKPTKKTPAVRKKPAAPRARAAGKKAKKRASPGASDRR